MEGSLKTIARALLRAYLRHSPLTDGKRRLYERYAARLAPAGTPVDAAFPGFRLRLDLRHATEREMYWFGTYERRESRLLRALLRPGDCVYDIGANLGYFTCLCAAAVGPAGRVIACEPFPASLARLREQVARNGFTQVRITAAALSDAAGSAPLYFAADAPDGEPSLVADAQQVNAVTVRTLTLDDLAAGERPPDLLKADVEGAEHAVLRGGRQTLATAGPLLLLECEDHQLAQHGSSKDALQELLRTCGYAAWQLQRRRWRPCADIRTARCRNLLFARPADARHRERLLAAGLTLP